MHFQYDNDGVPLGLNYNGKQYLYMTNPMGDVISIVNTGGKESVQYEYDEWGNTVAVTLLNNTEEERELAEANPLRYRGYYLDTETNYYYLQSRYYDPSICRFINADSFNYVDTDLKQGCNLFAYCGNCPTINIDLDGFCYYDVNLKWRHDNWEYKGNYKRKNAPGITNYLFPYSYKIAIPNGGSIRFSKAAKVNDMESTTNNVYYLTKTQANAATSVLAAKGAVNIIKSVITEYNKACKKGVKYTTNQLKDLILKELYKKLGKKVASKMASFVAVCAVDTSIITNQMLINAQIKRINSFINKGKGIRIYSAKYTNKATITLVGTSYISIDGWSNSKISNPTRSGFYLKKF